MNAYQRMVALCAVSLLGASACQAAQTLSTVDSRPPPAAAARARVIQVRVQIEAGASQFVVWPGGGKTWHHGNGFAQPLGLIQYWCGKDFPEQKSHPLPDWLRTFSKTFIGRADGDMLFCVYRLKDGDLYVYDNEPGVLTDFKDATGARREQTINFIVDGTGAYQGATGVWMGELEGRGASVFPSGTEAQVPQVLFKLMDGYLRLP